MIISNINSTSCPGAAGPVHRGAGSPEHMDRKSTVSSSSLEFKFVCFFLLGLDQNSLVSLWCHIKKPKKHDCYFYFIFWWGEALILKGGAFLNVCLCSLYHLHLCQLHSIQILVVRWSLLSCVRLFETPRTVAHQAPLTVGFSRQQYWSGLPCPPPGDLPDPGIESTSHVSCIWQVGSLPLAPSGKPYFS